MSHYLTTCMLSSLGRYRRSTTLVTVARYICMRMTGDSAGVFLHPSSCTLLFELAPPYDDSLDAFLHACRLSPWLVGRWDDTPDERLNVLLWMGRYMCSHSLVRCCYRWQISERKVGEGRKSRARYSLRFDLGSWGTGVSSICVDLLENFGSTG